MTIRRLVFAAIVFTSFGAELSATTYPAASCNESDVQAAYNSEQVSPADGDIITIPAGTCTWTSLWTLSPTNSITFKGAGAESATNGGASTTGTDQTVLTVDGDSNGSYMHLTTAAGKTYEITGLAIVKNASTPATTNGALLIDGASTAVRFDHNHLVSHVAGYRMVLIQGSVLGVADHNAIDENDVNNPFAIENGRGWNGDTAGLGDKSWADGSYWGSGNFFFVEDNWFNNLGTSGTYINDCSVGGREVIRYNTMTARGAIQAHEMTGDYRGCRAGEIYQNTFLNSVEAGNAVGTRSGTVLVWGNTFQLTKSIVGPSQDRANNLNSNFVPQGYAHCGNGNTTNGFVGVVNTSGTAVTLVSGNSSWNSVGGTTIQFPVTTPAAWPSESNPHIYINGLQYTVSTIKTATSLTLTTSAGIQTSVAYYVPSVWDGNADTTGYPCFDMPGRGKGDLLKGSFTTGNRVDTVTSTATWPNEAVDPIYVWGNTNTWPGDSADNVVALGLYNMFHDNQDYYQQMAVYCYGPPNNSCGENPSGITLSPGQTIPFTGVAGIGQGLLSARPSTCTAGIDPVTGGSVPGVGYWSTDKNTLYVCNPTNTWTAYYTPYTYPHPLTGTAPASPTNLAATAQ
jgi:hypothetical protein